MQRNNSDCEHDPYVQNHCAHCCCCCCRVASVASDSVRPHSRQPTRLPVPGLLQARALERAAAPFSSALHEPTLNVHNSAFIYVLSYSLVLERKAIALSLISTFAGHLIFMFFFLTGTCPTVNEMPHAWHSQASEIPSSAESL